MLIRMRTASVHAFLVLKIGGTSINNEMKGMAHQHSLESNPVPTSFLTSRGATIKKDVVGTGLDSRLCLFPSLLLMCHPYIPLHFIEMIFILVYNYT